MTFRAFVVARDSNVDAGTYSDEQGWFECVCAMAFPLENGADSCDITM